MRRVNIWKRIGPPRSPEARTKQERYKEPNVKVTALVTCFL